MSLTLLKGLMPHVPAMLPLLVSDPEMRFDIKSSKIRNNSDDFLLDQDYNDNRDSNSDDCLTLSGLQYHINQVTSGGNFHGSRVPREY